MKAITCTQCGATIENVSDRSLIVDCEYCGARMMMDRSSPPAAQPADPPQFYKPTSSTTPTATIITVIIAIVIGLPIIGALILGKSKTPDPRRAYSAPSSPVAYPTPSSWNYTAPEPSKPIPVVNYQPRVAWDGPNDMEHFEDPEVDISSVAHLTSEEVEKTVFKNRVVKLRVVINTEGEIDQVETISGHPILVAAATESAKRSIFRSRSKPTHRVLTYTFRVLKD